MIKIAKGIDPIETRQLVRTHLAGGFSWIPYRVYAVTGNATHAPSPDGPIIYLELVDKHPSTPAALYGVCALNSNISPA